jgi:O-antigen/teichoic acid export membrane protein
MITARRVFKAVPSLLALQGLQYLVPLITIPFLIRVLGLERWGQVAQLMALSQLALILLDYGLHLSATQTAARQPNNPEALAALFGAVTMAKLLIGFIWFPVILVIALWLTPLGPTDSLLLWALAATWLQAHDPFWYFLGTEQTRQITGLTIALRLAAVGVMIVGISGPDDAWIYFAAQGAAWLGILGAGWWMVKKQTRVEKKHLKGGITIIRDGRHIFYLYLGSSSFDYLLPLVLGAVADPVSVGLFVGAEKLARAAASLLSSFRSALFPQMSRLMAESAENAAALFRWALLRVGGLAAVGSIALFFSADWIAPLLLGEAAAAAGPILKILSPLPVLLTINSLIGVQWLLPAGRTAALRNIYLGAGALRLILCALLAHDFQAPGAALATIAGEVCVLIACLLYLRQHPVRGA